VVLKHNEPGPKGPMPHGKGLIPLASAIPLSCLAYLCFNVRCRIWDKSLFWYLMRCRTPNSSVWYWKFWYQAQSDIADHRYQTVCLASDKTSLLPKKKRIGNCFVTCKRISNAHSIFKGNLNRILKDSISCPIPGP
jgi:hypothetical protein